MTLQTIRIFKLITGEMVIGRLVSAIRGEDTYIAAKMTEDEINALELRACNSFIVSSPALVGAGPDMQMMTVPVAMWADPKSGPLATFSGSSVIAEFDMSQPCHGKFKAGYFTSVTGVEVVSSVVQGRFPKQ